MKQIYSHAPIPDPPWDALMISVQTRFLLSVDEVSDELIRRSEFMWGCLAHYLHQKRWDSKHKFPFRLTKEQRKALEAFGNYWDQRIELCVGCHANNSPHSRYYDNAAHWARQIVYEVKEAGLSATLAGEVKRGKINFVKALRCEVRDLEGGQNPEEQKFINSFRLYEDALLLRDSSDVFRKRYWSPYIHAFRQWIRSLETNSEWNSCWIEGSVLKEQIGKGNHQRGITKNLSFKSP